MKRNLVIIVLMVITMFGKVQIDGNAKEYISQKRAEYHLRRICDFLDYPEDSVGTIIITGTDSDEALHIANTTPDWGIGVAVPSRNVIIIKNVTYALDHVLAHEIAHIVLHKATGTWLPRWFDEGVAEYMSKQMSYTDFVKMGWLHLTGAPNFDDFEKIYQKERIIAENLYGLSFHAVYFLSKEFVPNNNIESSDLLGNIVYETRRLRNFEKGFEKATGVRTYEFEYEFRRHYRGKYGFIGTFFSTNTLWYGILLLFIIAGVTTLIRRRLSLSDSDENFSDIE